MYVRSITFIFSFCFLFLQKADAQRNEWRYLPTKIYLQDGDSLVTEVRMPIKHSETHKKSVVYVRGEKKRADKIAMADIKSMIVKTGDESGFVLENIGKLHRKGIRKMKTNDASKGLCLVDLHCQEFKTYKALHGVDLDKDGKIYEVYGDGLGYYLMKRKGEDYPTVVGSIALSKLAIRKSFIKDRKNRLKLYYANDPDKLNDLNSIEELSQKNFRQWLVDQCGGE